MEIKCLPLGDYQANCYIITDDESMTAAVVDPGVSSDELNDILLGYELKYILLTHGHFDHIYGCESLKNLYPECKICIHSADEQCLNSTEYNLAGDFDGYLPSLDADVVFEGNEELEIVPGVTVKVLHTPGHSKGSVCYTDFTNGFMFSGDTLFCRTVGRTDFIGGDFLEMMSSVRMLSTLNPEIQVFPGHNRSTTIGEEKIKNRYMRKL